MTWSPEDSLRRMSAAVDELGPPIYGLPQGAGQLAMHGGSPCTEIAVAFRGATAAQQITVTTSRRRLGGTESMLRQLIASTIGTKPTLPWSLQVDEAHHMVTVETGRAQFRVLSASTGHWLAAGGYGKRHLLIAGTPGTDITSCDLVPVRFAYDGYPASAHADDRA